MHNMFILPLSTFCMPPQLAFRMCHPGLCKAPRQGPRAGISLEGMPAWGKHEGVRRDGIEEQSACNASLVPHERKKDRGLEEHNSTAMQSEKGLARKSRVLGSKSAEELCVSWKQTYLNQTSTLISWKQPVGSMVFTPKMEGLWRSAAGDFGHWYFLQLEGRL